MKDTYVPSKIKTSTEATPWNRFRKQIQNKESNIPIQKIMEKLVDKVKGIGLNRR